MASDNAADDAPIVAPNSVSACVRGLIMSATAPGRGWSYDSLADATGLKPRRLKSYVHEGKEPSLSAALSIAVVLGKPAVNAVLAIIGYSGAAPIDEADEDCPRMSAVTSLTALARFTACAADGRIDHTEEREATEAVDLIIAELAPWSSTGRAS